jgi:hypothetical protein
VTADNGYSWVRITAAGLHALADAAEKYGWPELEKAGAHVQTCSNCEREWKSKCIHCGSRTYHYAYKEYDHAAA